MKTTLRVYANNDDALLVWTADELDPSLRGFAIRRRRKESAHGHVAETWLDNYAPPGIGAHQKGTHQPSDEWPFRSFAWTDHGVNAGDHVRYRVVPLLVGAEAPDETLASDWSDWREVGYPDGAAYRGYFNRGFVISQFMSRYLDEHFPHAKDRVDALKQFKQQISSDVEDRIRLFLSGDVRTRLLDLLDEIGAGTGQIHAALFELGDDELIGRLVKLGPRAHVVLANGSIEAAKGEPAAEARKRDENAAARKTLLDAGVDVEEKNRFVAPGALAHNKFLVESDAAGTAKRVWTGSTNWTTTGLCTQLNNALLIEDDGVAAAYLEQWKALRNAGSSHPGELADRNATPEESGRASVHFTRARKRVDLTALGAIVDGANEGVLFLMFIPGSAGVLASVEGLIAARPGLVVRGVVSELPNGRADEKTGDSTTVRVHVVGGADGTITRTVEVVQPEGKAHPTAFWAAETTHDQFKQGIGWAIIHSKVLVVDPFSDDPTVVTGSHNFSISASEKNDENFVVVRGDRALAEAYAVNVDSAWRHYAARIASPHPELMGFGYLDALLGDRRADETFWHLA